MSPATGSRSPATLDSATIALSTRPHGLGVSGERGAAKILGLEPTTLEARMKKLSLPQTSAPDMS